MYVYKLIINILFLVVTTRNDISKQIEITCKEICENKLKIKDSSYKYTGKMSVELINMKEEEGIYLKELNIYILKLLNYLWVQPKLTADILYHANNYDIDENLAPFVCNFFYENFLSPDCIQDNLLYIITIVLQKEIMNLKSTKDFNIFLSNSCGGFLLNELKNKYEIKKYFKRIICKTIEKLEYQYYNVKLNFRIPYNISLEEENKKNLFKEEHDFNHIIDENKKIINKYFLSLTKEFIIKEKENYENDNGQNIYDEYLDMFTKDRKYENFKFFESLEITEELKKSYLYNFCLVTDCINQIISDFLLNLSAFPYSLKCICKIIYILIKQRFPNITIKERYTYIGRFIFYKLLIPLLCEPAKEFIVTEYLIFDNTIFNLRMLSEIFNKLILGELYSMEENNYLAFNLFFMDKVKDMAKIYEDVTKVKLPNYIEKIIYNPEENFEFNYEELNKEDILHSKFICFQFDDIIAIIDSLTKNYDYFFKDDKNVGLRKTYEKLTNENSTEIIQEIKDDKSTILSLKYAKDLSQKHYYFYIYDITINKEYEKYFKLELNDTIITANLIGASEKEKIKNNIQKVKDCICSVLENYQTLSEKRFLEEKIKDTKSIFQEIKKTAYLDNYFINNTIPSKWYISSLFEYLEKLPPNYIENDYELIFTEIEKDMNDFIQTLSFEFLSSFQERLNFSKKHLDNYKNSRKRINVYYLNKGIIDIIRDEFIPISLYFNYNEKVLEIQNIIISEEQFDKDILVIKEKNKSFIICKTIRAFTKAFPNLVKYEELQDENILELIENLNLPKKIFYYFDVINSFLKKSHKTDIIKHLTRYQSKLEDFIMARIYNKIFPKTEEKDDKIYRQSILLSWTEPKHFIPAKKIFNLDGIKSDIYEHLNKFQEKKFPSVKLKYLSKIFKLILEAAKFYGQELKGVEDTLNYLYYLIIKEKPTKLYSTCKYLELFNINKEKKKDGDDHLSILMSICDYICEMKFNSLLKVSKEEYMNKCKEAAENDSSDK